VREVLEHSNESRDGMNASLLSTRSLRKDHGQGAAQVRAVCDVDLDIDAGEAVAIVGPSGCGKSSLLYLLGGLDRPTAGKICLDGRRIDGLRETGLARLRRDSIGFVFQAFELVDELTAVENVELPALLARRSPRAARRRAMDLLDQVGLGDRAEHLPAELSGGQRQRAAIARAIANEPRVVLADEPTGNLDSAAATDVLRLFDQVRASGLTLVIVTHDTRIAATADRLISMRDGAFVDETRLTGGTGRRLGEITGLEAGS
jgi:ABC-type lipoprotein export system ATPase subunit